MYQPFSQTVLQNINRTMLYRCRKSTQNNVKPPLHASLIPAELHRAAKKLPSCLRKKKNSRRTPPTTSTPTTKEETRPYSRTHTHHHSHTDNKETHKIERLNAQKSLYSTTTYKATKTTSTTTTNQKKKCNKEASAEEAEENTPKAPGI
jgi:hypothetical protein